jgi:hypothetical protein
MYLCTYAAPHSPMIILPLAEIQNFACMPICYAILHLVLPWPFALGRLLVQVTTTYGYCGAEPN